MTTPVPSPPSSPASGGSPASPAARPPRNRSRLRKHLRRAGAVCAGVCLVVTLIWLRTRTRYAGRLYDDVTRVPGRPVAIVFGAGLRADGTPSAVLEDRVLTAVALYKAGRIERLLMSGDNSRRGYDESTAMKRLAVAEGVPADHIVLDCAGFRTYDTCYRARDIFGVTSAVLVTQQFHLPRALYCANRLGIDAVGVTADRRRYMRAATYSLREVAACVVAWVQVNVTKPRPHFLGPREPIFPAEPAPAPVRRA